VFYGVAYLSNAQEYLIAYTLIIDKLSLMMDVVVRYTIGMSTNKRDDSLLPNNKHQTQVYLIVPFQPQRALAKHSKYN